MIRLACLGAAFAVGALTVLASVPVARAQEEIEIVTEPPSSAEPSPGEPSAEPSPGEPSAEPEPVPDIPPKVEPPKQKLGQLRVGGGIGFGFGADLFSLGIAPQVSYVFKKIVEPGVSLLYEYTNDRYVEPNAIWHTFGSSLFVRLYPIPSLFVLVEGQLINTGFKQGGFTSGRENFGNLWLGGGYIMGVGRGAFVAISIKVNVFRNPIFPANIPVIGFGAGFGF